MKELLAESINILGGFCGKRDLNALTSTELNRVCGIEQADGYGPMGKDFIAHVDLPEKVQNAFMILKENYGDKIRAAKPITSRASIADSVIILDR